METPENLQKVMKDLKILQKEPLGKTSEIYIKDPPSAISMEKVAVAVQDPQILALIKSKLEALSKEDMSVIRNKEKNSIIRDIKKIGDQAAYHYDSSGILDPIYIEGRDRLLEAARQDKRAFTRRLAAKEIEILTRKTLDPTIIRFLNDTVKKIAKKDGKQSQPISHEEELAMRVLFSLNTPDSDRMIFQLFQIDDLDPRIKKLALENLLENDFFTLEIGRHIESVLESESKDIRWEDFNTLSAIVSLPSRELRDQIKDVVDSVFVKLVKTPEGITRLGTTYRSIPPEALLQAYEISVSQNIPLGKINDLFAATRSSHSQEELTFILTSLLTADERYSERVAQKRTMAGIILKALIIRPFNKTDLPAITQALKKGLFIVSQSYEKPAFFLDLVKGILNPDEEKEYFLERTKYVLETSTEDFKEKRLKELSKYQDKVGSVSIEEISQILTQNIIDTFVKLFPEGAINEAFLKKLIIAWPNFNPFFIYTSKIKSSQQEKNIPLFGDMINHIDPPNMTKWKKWRYGLENPNVREQIGFMTKRAQKLYQKDCIIDLKEILVGSEPKDIPMEIRKIIYHAFSEHDYDEPSTARMGNYLGDFFSSLAIDDPDFENKITAKTQELSLDLKTLQEIVSLRDELKIAERAAVTTERWRKSEAEKQISLTRLGYPQNLSVDDVANEIAKLKAINYYYLAEKNIENYANRGFISEYIKFRHQEKYLQTQGKELDPNDKKRFDEIVALFSRSIGANYDEQIETYRMISTLSGSSPRALDARLATFMEKHALDPNSATAEDFDLVQNKLKQDLASVETSVEFKDLSKNLGISTQAGDRELYLTIESSTTAIKILELLILNPQLIGQNKLGKGQIEISNLTTTVKKLSRYFESTAIAIEFDRIIDILGTFATPAKEENLLFIFTDNPLIGLTIGRYPNGAQSCQKYWFGDRSLASYCTDAMTKLALLVNKNKIPENILEALEAANTEREKVSIFNKNVDQFLDAIVARRVVKMVKNEETQKPYVFLEPIYTPLDRSKMTKIMDSAVKQLLQEKDGFRLVKGTSTENLEGFQVRVAQTRGEAQYEDGESGGPNAGGMGRMNESYTMPARFLREDEFHSEKPV